MAETIAIATAVLALAVSIVTAWLTYFHRGAIRMAEPSMVVFAYDAAGSRPGFVPKVMVRCLLFSTGERGRVIEALFARTRIAGSEYTLPVWGMDADSKLVRGGGLLVPKGGVVAWHHFVAFSNGPGVNFTPGVYEVKVFARVHGRSRPVELWSRTLTVSDDVAPTSHDGSEQVWFDHHPEADGFEARRESRAPANNGIEAGPWVHLPCGCRLRGIRSGREVSGWRERVLRARLTSHDASRHNARAVRLAHGAPRSLHREARQ
jgi:hypothetical protein